jgi:hypothetical protein
MLARVASIVSRVMKIIFPYSPHSDGSARRGRTRLPSTVSTNRVRGGLNISEFLCFRRFSRARYIFPATPRAKNDISRMLAGRCSCPPPRIPPPDPTSRAMFCGAQKTPPGKSGGSRRRSPSRTAGGPELSMILGNHAWATWRTSARSPECALRRLPPPWAYYATTCRRPKSTRIAPSCHPPRLQMIFPERPRLGAAVLASSAPPCP